MNITFRQLRLLLALADTGSVSQAARAMHVTQPTASMQLKEIAGKVGLPLFELVGRKPRLTDAGRELAATARDMLRAWESFEQYADGAKGLARGRIKVAVVSTAKYFMPRLLGGFCKQHPQIDLSLEVLNRDGVVQRLRDNLDDLYIMSIPPADMQLGDTVFMSNPIAVIAPSVHPLCKRGQLTLADLKGQRFILREKGSGTRMVVERHLRKARFRPDVRLELGSNEAVKESVAGGLGLGMVSVHALGGMGRGAGVRVLDVKGFPLPSAWHIVHPAGRKLSPLAAAFKDHLLAEARQSRWSQFGV